jgi:hypothetical protein
MWSCEFGAEITGPYFIEHIHVPINLNSLAVCVTECMYLHVISIGELDYWSFEHLC